MRTAASFETDISVNGHLRPGKGSYTLNYEGRHIPPRQSNSVSGSSLPWMLHPSLETLEGFERLRVELQAFDTWIKPTAAEHAAREAVVHDVFAFAKKIIPESSLELFGSHRTGLSVATSDIDFRIYQPDVGQGAGDRGPNLTKPSSRKLNTRRLQLLYSAMAEAEGFMVTAMRPLAKYPLMTVQHLDSGVDIQIVVSNDTVASREYIKKYLAQYPALGTVYMVIKMMLNVRGLSDVYHGGLGSYSIFMMVVASLELHYNNRRDDLAQHLLSFFSLYSKLDTSRMGVSVDPPMLFAKTPNGKPKLAEKQYDDATAAGRHQIGVVDPLQPYLFCLQDPADSLNDLGKRSYGIKHIQETIRVLHKGLLQKVASPSKESLLSPLVGGCYELIEERRSRLEAYGEPFLEAKQEVLR